VVEEYSLREDLVKTFTRATAPSHVCDFGEELICSCPPIMEGNAFPPGPHFVCSQRNLLPKTLSRVFG